MAKSKQSFQEIREKQRIKDEKKEKREYIYRLLISKMDSVKEITKMIDYYSKNYKKLSINQLLDFQDKLSAFSYYLADEMATMKDHYNSYYFARKINFNKKKQAYINNGDSAAKAETSANVDVEEYYDKELEFESMGYRLDVLLRQVNKILNSVQQRISFLKLEHESSKKQV